MSFVSGKTEKLDETTLPDGEDDNDDSDGSSDETSENEESAPSPRVVDDLTDEPSHSGLGASSSMASHFAAPITTSSAAPSASEGPAAQDAPARAGIGSRGGIGSASRSGIGNASTSTSFDSSNSLPTSFGSPVASSTPSGTRTQRSFLRDGGGPRSQSPSLSAEEKQHFQKLSGTYGARLMSKMGWEAVRLTPFTMLIYFGYSMSSFSYFQGQGLGLTNVGIVTPIEAKLRPKAAGIAYKGFKEKTEQSKREARRYDIMCPYLRRFFNFVSL